MNWIPLNNVTGFHGAEAVFQADLWILARWNHSQCQGWQLYHIPNRQSPKTKWIIGAGSESLQWTGEQATAWAEMGIMRNGQRR